MPTPLNAWLPPPTLREAGRLDHPAQAPPRQRWYGRGSPGASRKAWPLPFSRGPAPSHPVP
jgi:hypothetical protein